MGEGSDTGGKAAVCNGEQEPNEMSGFSRRVM